MAYFAGPGAWISGLETQPTIPRFFFAALISLPAGGVYLVQAVSLPVLYFGRYLVFLANPDGYFFVLKLGTDTGFLCLNWGVLVLFGTQPFSKLRRYSQAAVGTVRIPVEAFRPPADPAVIQPLYRARFDRNHKLRYALARGAHLVRMQTVVLELNVTTLAFLIHCSLPAIGAFCQSPTGIPLSSFHSTRSNGVRPAGHGYTCLPFC